MTQITLTDEDSNLVQHAIRELDLIGEDENADYDGMIRDAVLGLVRTFSRQGHSGFSAGYTLSLVTRLLAFEPLSPLTDDPAEWHHVEEAAAGPDVWQCRRNPSAFSNDGGKTYYLVSDDERRLQPTAPKD